MEGFKSDSNNSNHVIDYLNVNNNEININENHDIVVPNINKYNPKAFDVWSLGIAVVIGGQYIGWNEGLSAGFGSYCIALSLIGSGYLCLILCLSEMISALPFSGGAYGLARLLIGFYPGFMVGIFEAIEYILYVSASVIQLSILICDITMIDDYYQPVICLLFYLTAVPIHIIGGPLFWRFNKILAIFSITLLLICCFGSMRYDDFDLYSCNQGNSNHNINGYFSGGIYEFMKVFPLATWFYVGIESLAFTNDVVYNPKKTVGYGTILCMSTLLVTSILVIFTTCSLPPGIYYVYHDNAALTKGFTLIFHINQQFATILSIPAIYATAFGFIFPYGKLLQSMSLSNLLPEILSRTSSSSDTPYVAIIFGSIIGYCVCLLLLYYKYLYNNLYSILILAGFLSYIAICIGYIHLKHSFKDLSREIISPFGIYGAIYSILINLLGVISIIGFQNDQQIAFIIFIIIGIIFTMYYYYYVKTKQTLSKNELSTIYKEQVVKFNVRNNKIIQRKFRRNFIFPSSPSFLRPVSSIEMRRPSGTLV